MRKINISIALIIAGGLVYFLAKTDTKAPKQFTVINSSLLENNKFTEEEREDYSEERIKHEFEMLRNPITGKIPDNYHEVELKAVENIQSRYIQTATNVPGGPLNPFNNNTYSSVGPNNVGGRSRTLAFDKRNANIMLTGGVTGGIFRSTDGGANWSFVSPENEIRSITTIVQDGKTPDTWYAGSGEVYYSASAADIAGTFGYGIFKSTDNGVTWVKLPATEDGDPNNFAGGFDLVHRLAVNPTNGDVFAAVHRRIYRSTDGGNSWSIVLGGSVASTSTQGICDVFITPTGNKIFATMSGANPDRTLAGVWESATGASGSWTRIAGGVSGGSDSIPGWAAYGKWSRIVMALSPANKLYVLYKNGASASGSSAVPEADLFQADISSGNSSTYVWKNLSAFVPNDAGGNRDGINPYTTQFSGYDMCIAVKPDDENTLFIGGTCLWRVNLNGTTNANKFTRAGGYGSGFFTNNFIYPNHHPDIHGVFFAPNMNTVLYTVDDGGVQKTNTALSADTIKWTALNTGLQTLQYQFVSIIPDLQASWIIGGAQDNGTYANLNVPSSLSHTQINGGDGASSSITEFRGSGTTLQQYFFSTVVQSGDFTRTNITWQNNNGSLSATNVTFDEILPQGLPPNGGQWLTLFIQDQDSTDHIYYNFKNRLFRAKNATTVDSTGWTELLGVGNTLGSSTNVSAMAISKRKSGIKYLFMGTNSGKLYRLNNANMVTASATPVDITPSSMVSGSYVSGVSINPRSADTVLVTVSNYDASGSTVPNIFWTGNATAASPTWQVLDGALAPVSSQSCAIAVKSTGVEYYVGTSVGLYSTTAVNGNSTTWLNEGSGMMKKAIIRSLAYRQQDNTLVVGTHGNGAFLASLGNAITIPADIITAVSSVNLNDKNFIKQIYPTLTKGDVYYKAGGLLSINKINCSVYSSSGQLISSNSASYSDGVIHLGNYSNAPYIIVITSADNKYKTVQKVIKQ